MIYDREKEDRGAEVHLAIRHFGTLCQMVTWQWPPYQQDVGTVSLAPNRLLPVEAGRMSTSDGLGA